MSSPVPHKVPRAGVARAALALGETTEIVSVPRKRFAERSATAPRGNVNQPSRRHVTEPRLPVPNATNTVNSGEAEL